MYKLKKSYISKIEQLPDLIWKINSNKKYTYFNKNWKEFTGESTEIYIKENNILGMHPDDMPIFEKEFSKAFNNKETFTILYRLKRLDGLYRCMVSRGKPAYDMHGKFLGYIGMDIDITDQNKESNGLIRLKEEAERVNKTKNEFFANMSHEIRTPLNGIIGMTDLTLSTNLTEEQKENISIIKNCSDTLLNLINNILDLSKIEAEKVSIVQSEFDIDILIKKVIDTNLAKAQEKNIEIVYIINPEVHKLLIGDFYRLQQVLNNLVSNAVKFTDKGSVKLTVEEISNLDDVSEMKFTVEDSGIGISKDEMQFLFKSFSQVDGSITRKYGGTGLGLAISKKLVELMGGNIIVESEKGKGSKFSFSIRLSQSKNVQKQLKSNIKYTKKFNNSSILLVEDDKVNQIVIKKMLFEIGYEKVEIASNGIQAIKLIDIKDYDTILMDIQMPELDGIQTTHIIREKEKKSGKHTPIIAVTAYALKGDREKFLASGMDNYISKPIDINILIETLNKIENPIQKNEADITLNYLNKIKDKNNEVIKEINIDNRLYIMSMLNELKSYLIIDTEKTNQTYYQIERIAHDIKVKSQENDYNLIKNLSFKIELAARKKDFDSIQNNYEKMYNVFRETLKINSDVLK